MADIVKVEDNLELKNKSLRLLSYDETTDAKAEKEVQAVFKGFNYDKDFNPAEMFKTADQIGKYAANTVKELEDADNKFKIGAIKNQGAIAAKRWHFGFMIAKCLASANYGSDLASKIASEASISQTYLYQYRAVGERLSLKESYLLGMYGAGWECIRKLAALNDDDHRHNLIKMFIASIPDYNNAMMREQAKLALNQAIENLKSVPKTLSIEAPAEIEAMANFDKEAPEFVNCNKQIDSIMSAMRGLLKKNKNDAFTVACADCYLPNSVNGAADRLEDFHEKCKDALKLLQEVENFLPSIKQELESLENMPLASNE